jgi:hypothetical protein
MAYYFRASSFDVGLLTGAYYNALCRVLQIKVAQGSGKRSGDEGSLTPAIYSNRRGDPKQPSVAVALGEAVPRPYSPAQN